MTFAPAPLIALGKYLVSQGCVNLGVVGDTGHQTRGVSYHLGQSQLTETAYSRMLPRDREPYLTEAAAAIDIGKVSGGYPGLRALSSWLASQCQRRAVDTLDIREVIYSPDGQKVLRWDEPTQTTYPGGTGTGQGDDSHLTHTHISFYRDSETRDKFAVFRRYFEEEDVQTTITVLPFGGTYVIEANTAPVGIKFDPATGVIGPTLAWPASYETPSGAAYDAVMTTTAMRGSPFLRCTNGHFAGYWLSAGQVTETPTPAPLPDCTAEVLAARHVEYARVTGGTTATATVAFPEPPA